MTDCAGVVALCGGIVVRGRSAVGHVIRGVSAKNPVLPGFSFRAWSFEPVQIAPSAER